MLTRMTTRLGAAAVLLLLVSAVPADAQIDRLRRAVQERVQSTAVRESTGQAAGPVYNADVLEMTPEVLERLARALAVEETKLREKQARAAQDRREEQWQACNENVPNRPEFQKRVEELQARGVALSEQMRAGKLDREAMARAQIEIAAAAMALQNDMQEAATKECGPRPESQPTPVSPDEPLDNPVKRALEEGSFTERQYAILKERITPFCAAGIQADDEVRIPGTGKGVYVYSRSEARALAPRCAELSTLLQAVL